MNTILENNFKKLNWSVLYIPTFLLFFITLFLFTQNALSTGQYIEIQLDLFYYINSQLSRYPHIQYNLTQFGDAFIFLSILSIFFVRAPKLWEALITASLISGLFSKILKEIFCVPRPAAILDHKTFTIIGAIHGGTKSSLPSGHAITIFTVITILLFGFLPKKNIKKLMWFISLIFIGLALIFTRVAVGAHFPLDVIIGGIVGYISAIIGIFINQKYNVWTWIGQKQYYPIFILLFAISAILVTTKIISENLLIFNLSLLCLLYSLIAIIYTYAKK